MRGLESLLIVMSLAALSVSAADDVKIGDPAPSFSVMGSDGKTYQLASYKGKQAVVLAWFAKAFTGG